MRFMVEKKGAPRRKSPRRQTAQNPAHARRARCPPASESGSELSTRPVISPSLCVNRPSLLYPKSCVESSGLAPPAMFLNASGIKAQSYMNDMQLVGSHLPHKLLKIPERHCL